MEAIQEIEEKEVGRFMISNIRLLAPLSLIFATGGFVCTLFLPSTFFVSILRSFFEAAMIGGLADWFAVVALFRRPLGLPIPHTAIIPRNRAKIEQAIVGMVNTLLPPETIISRIAQLDIVGRFIAFWDEETKRKWFMSILGRTLHTILARIDVKEAALILCEFGKAAATGWAPRISKEAARYLAANYNKAYSTPERLFALCVQALNNFVKSRGSVEFLQRALEELLDTVTLTAWLKWCGVLNSRELSEKIIARVSYGVELELNKEPNLLRDGYKQIYKNVTRQLNDPQSQTSLTLDKWWNGIVNGGDALAVIEKYLRRYLTDALEDLEEDDSRIQANIELALIRLVANLKADSKSRERAATWVNKQLSSLVLTNHSNIAQIVRDTLEKNFSDEKLVRWIEEKVGADLQYIRLNGALVGGLVGVGIFFLRSAFG
jgi:uncharacterized membrane-anchored protein YjiN (DUF445 family)